MADPTLPSVSKTQGASPQGGACPNMEDSDSKSVLINGRHQYFVWCKLVMKFEKSITRFCVIVPQQSVSKTQQAQSNSTIQDQVILRTQLTWFRGVVQDSVNFRPNLKISHKIMPCKDFVHEWSTDHISRCRKYRTDYWTDHDSRVAKDCYSNLYIDRSISFKRKEYNILTDLLK